VPKTPDDLIRRELRALKAYHVPDSSGMVKLDAMENPYSLPADVRIAIARKLENVALNRYPDADARELKERVRSAMHVPSGMDIVLGNGSDELIQMLALTLARPQAVMLGFEPSFVMFGLIADVVGMRFVGVPLQADFTVDLDATLTAIAQHEPALIFIAYPNNPSGNLFDRSVLTRILEAAPGVVVLDEAYHAFAGASFMPQLADYPNLVVMRTVSKLGLAGLRLGVLAGRRTWLEHVDKVRLPYNINVLSQIAASEVLRHGDMLGSQAAGIRSERGRLASALRSMRSVESYTSDANFILFRVADADHVFTALKQRRVLIKNLHGTHRLLAGCLRVTVGTPDENDQFLSALAAVI